MLILKAASKRHAGEVHECIAPHQRPEKATWELEVNHVGVLHVCTNHYRELTEWECGNERKCNKVNYGLSQHCSCGWVRPDTCGKCGEPSAVPLIKITEKREPHECHSCRGSYNEQVIVKCGTCDGGNLTVTRDCISCYGTGRLTEGDVLCPGCNGTKRAIIVCKTCKGLGETFGWSDQTCTSCNGSGICRASSANWGLDRIPLTDLDPQHRDGMQPYIGKYLCFRCANPDFSFSPYRDGEQVQCQHNNMPGQDRCTQMISRHNAGLKFCFMHTKNHQCSVCGNHLELDEWGGRCREHAKCARCNDVPVAGSIFCPSHQEYKALGRMLEKERPLESPPQILKALEDVSKARSEHEERCNRSLDRSRENSDKLRAAQQEQYDILQLDSAENRARLKEVAELKVKIGKLDPASPNVSVDTDWFNRQINVFEREIAKDRRYEDRKRFKQLAWDIKKLEAWVKQDIAEYVRCRHIMGELFELLERIRELRHYKLWDPKSTPEYYGEPLNVLCKSCEKEFNVRTPRKWLCPNCTTVETIDIGLKATSPGGERHEVRPPYKKYELGNVYGEKFVKTTFQTDNIPERKHELVLQCEVCREVVWRGMKRHGMGTGLCIEQVDGLIECGKPVLKNNPSRFFCKDHTKVVWARLFLREKFLLSENPVAQGQPYVACHKCAYWEGFQGSKIRDVRYKELGGTAKAKELEFIQLKSLCKQISNEVFKKTRPAPVLADGFVRHPEIVLLPPSMTVPEVKKEREKKAKEEREKKADESLKTFLARLDQDRLTLVERIEMGKLRINLFDALKEFPEKFGKYKKLITHGKEIEV